MEFDYKKSLIAKYDAFSVEQNAQKKKFLQSEVINALNGIASLDADDFYMWGLTYYMTHEEPEVRLKKALDRFLQACQIDPEHMMACLYTAHCYHDMGDYKSALQYYLSVNRQEMKEFQVWRYVKLIEQIGFCYHQLGDEPEGRRYFKKVLAWYRKLPMDERVVPTELLQCLDPTDPIVTEIKQIEDYLD